MYPFSLWLEAFALTCAIELPIYWLVLRRRLTPTWLLLGVALVAQLATHPALWYVVPAPYDLGLSWVAWLLVFESLVTLVEALIVALALRRLPPTPRFGYAFAAASAANVTSTLIGIAVMH